MDCPNEQDESCFTAKRQGTQDTDNENAASSQHSSESEKELEEKGEKELEDDKEEMDEAQKPLRSRNYTVTGNNPLAVTFRAGPIRDDAHTTAQLLNGSRVSHARHTSFRLNLTFNHIWAGPQGSMPRPRRKK